jgi:two-component system OmpR family response regulator
MTQPLALIIEDNQDQALVFSTALEMAGFQTESIADGAAAQARLADTTPAIIVLDLHIPHITGEALFRQIRASKRLKNTYVLLATADASLAEELRPEADLVLLKPISFAQLNLLAKRFHDHPKP